MGITAAAPASRRGYLSHEELEQFSDITVTDADEANDRISQAEELIDAYVGFQQQFLPNAIKGRCDTAGASGYLYLEADQLNVFQDDYFVNCEIEIIGGTGAGQRRRITASDYETGKITVSDVFTTTPDNTSFYKIYQLGKFPRLEDVIYYTTTTPEKYYKSIPECVKRAVAAQVEFIVKMGDDYFATDMAEKISENISTYSYSKASGGLNSLIAPKAKMLLREVLNRTGEIA